MTPAPPRPAQPKLSTTDSTGGDEMLRAIFESASDFGIVATDAEGMVTSWSAGAERLFGYSQRQMLGRDVGTLYMDADREAGVPEAERREALAMGRAESERWYLRHDGSRVWGIGVTTPLKAPARGFVTILRDMTARRQMDQQLRDSEAHFRMMATNIPQLLFCSSSNGSRTWGSPQWATYTGLSDGDSRDLRWLEAVHPDDRDATIAAWSDALQLSEYRFEHRIRHAEDGDYRWHRTQARPLPEDPMRWIGTSSDVHDLRMLQDRQKVLLSELQHRTRNLLSLVQSLARQTLRTSASLESFGARYESRLQSLARVQGLLARSDAAAIGLHDLVRAELDAHVERGADKVRIKGSAVALPAGAAQTLSLALHELATNAVKYGALRQPQGRLNVTWRVLDQDGVPNIALLWRERGVPMPPERPARKGYGSELIERALPYQLKAKTSLEFDADGVRCSITVPLEGEGGGS